MPTRLCLEPRCPNPQTYRGRCADHARTTNRNTHRNRTVYNSRRWRLLRRRVLFEQPICAACDDALATDVDHITAIEAGGDPWSRANLQPMCHSCHAQKTRREQQVHPEVSRMPRGVYPRTPEILASLRAAAQQRSADSGRCQVAGCDSPSSGKRANICEMHYYRWRRTGQYTLAGPRKRTETPGYGTAHARVRYERGKASLYACDDCGDPARHWSFAWRRVSHDLWLWSEDNGLRPYSGNADHYDARCSICAAWYDKGYLPDGAWIPRKEQATP